MKNNIINSLINGEIKIPKELSGNVITTKKVEISSGAIKQIPAFIKENFASKKPFKIAIISDDNTHVVAGAALEALLACEKQFEVYSVVIPENVDADIENVNLISAYCDSCDLVISVGSGTMNDLCKYSSFTKKKNYITVPTAPSVNGYTSSTASISEGGLKKSLKAHLPIAVFMDVDIMVDAPERLIISGFGDSLARSTARADWLLSNFIFGTPYSEFVFDILAEDEEFIFANPEKIIDRDYLGIEALCRLLILSGFGMHLAGSSAPASQAEHLIAHYVESIFGEEVPHTYHGEQIAVTSVAVAKLQERILALDEVQISPIILTEKPLLKYFGEEKGTQLLLEVMQKQIGEGKCEEVNKKFKAEWKNLKASILENYITSKQMEDALRKLKGPYTYKHLGWNHEQFAAAFNNCIYLRNRFTFLDLAVGMRGQFEGVDKT